MAEYVLSNSAYLFRTPDYPSFLFQLLMQYWLIVDLPVVWNFTDHSVVVATCQLLHVLGWLSIFSTVYILDFYEFIGVKQVEIILANKLC